MTRDELTQPDLIDRQPPFRLALVGAGMITRQSHLPAALASRLAEVAAIVDPVEERARALARDYGVTPRISTNLTEVLPDVDGAVIATPNDSHHTLAIECLRAGVPALIEKPLASNYAEGEAIVLEAERARQVVAVGYSTRFRRNVELLKQLVDHQTFGEVRRFAHQFGTAGGWAPLSSYTLDRRSAGGGVLVVTATHFLDRMLYLFGYPDELSLVDDSTGGPEANCVASFRYGTGDTMIEGIARYSKTTRLPGGLALETTEGQLVLADDDDADIVFRPNAQPGLEHIVRSRERRKPVAQIPVFQQQIDDFVRACREGRPPRVDGRTGLVSVRLIDDLYARRRSSAPDYYAQTSAPQG